MSDPTPPATPPAPPAAAAPAPAPAAAPPPAMEKPKSGSKKPLIILAVLFVTVGIVFTVYHLLIGQFHVSTDNAYVGGNLVQVTPQVSGTITEIAADDTDLVQAGQLLVQFDGADTSVALAQAEADLAAAVRSVRTLVANTAGLDAQVAARQAEVAQAQASVAQAVAEYQRRAELKGTGAVSTEELSNAATAVTSARARLAIVQGGVATARESLSANRAQLDDSVIETQPTVQRAAAAVRSAYLNNGRNGLIAPITGYVAKRSAQLGARVQAGAPLMAVVALDNLWVDANFKEAQLAKVRIGQPATLTSDFYGSDVEYHGTVAGIGSGTGSAYSLLPAQNATGNWIKVVQRLPVRIVLDAKELKDHPLRVGLSMEVDLDIHEQGGAQLATAPRQQPAYSTDIYEALASKADARIEEIIRANAGRATR